MNLDPPPMLENLFLESPWAVMAVCLIAVVVLLIVWRQNQKKILALLALVPLVLAGGVWLLAGAVTTDREQLIQDTQDLVAATSPLDPAALDRLIDPTATVSGPDGSVWLNANQLRPRLRSALSRVSLNDQRTRSIQAIAHDTGWGESTVIVRSDFSGGAPLNTGWHLSWHREPGTNGAWRVVEIRWLRFQGQEVQRGMMP
jgi:hypothetical protein